MEISILGASHQATAVLIRSQQQQPHMPSCDLPSRHCAVLSDLCRKHRSSARELSLWGPYVGCRALQSLTHSSQSQLESTILVDSPQLGLQSMSLSNCWPSMTTISISGSSLDAAALLQMGTMWPRLYFLDLSNQLDANALGALRQVEWAYLGILCLNCNKLGSTGMQHLVSCYLPSLTTLLLKAACIDAPALRYLAQGRWPKLIHLNLRQNHTDAAGVSYLLEGSWPKLSSLCLSVKFLDDKAYLLLGMTEKEMCSVMGSCMLYVANPNGTSSYDCHRAHLPQFPTLYFTFCYD